MARLVIASCGFASGLRFEDSATVARFVPARAGVSLWVPSQNGVIRDFPHRQRATVCRFREITSPVESGRGVLDE